MAAILSRGRSVNPPPPPLFLRLEYSWRYMSMSWLPMICPLMPPDYRQPRYWLFKDKCVIVFHERGFHLPVPSQRWEMMEIFYISLRIFSRIKFSYCVPAILTESGPCTGRETKGNDHCCHWIACTKCNKTALCQTKAVRKSNYSAVYLSLKTADTLLLDNDS